MNHPLPVVLPRAWTAIAIKPRDGHHEWTPVAGAPIAPEEARRLVEQSVIFMATRYDANLATLLVRAR